MKIALSLCKHGFTKVSGHVNEISDRPNKGWQSGRFVRQAKPERAIELRAAGIANSLGVQRSTVYEYFKTAGR